MTDLLAKRKSLHLALRAQKLQNEQLKSRLNRSAALANIGTISAMIAHEINNILTPMGTYAELAANNPQDSELTRKALGKVVIGCRRAGDILDSMLKMASGQTQPKQPCNIAETLELVMDCLARDFSKDSITVKFEVPLDLTVSAVPVQLQQLFMNIILNAREAMLGSGGRLVVKAWRDTANVIIEFADTGCGIKPENIDRIFEPFFTTKSVGDGHSRNGTGLGLAFCKEVAAAHGGSITVNSQYGFGTTFCITLPAQPQ